MNWSNLPQFTWQDWVAIISFTFGIVSLIAYYDQRRSTRRTASLIKWAELNLDKSISEEQIKSLLAQKEVMEEQITRKIPDLARNAVLQEEAKFHEKAVAEHFAALQAINRELQSESVDSSLDPQLQQAIIDLILPRYMRLDRRDRLRTRVTVLSVALAASSAIMPFPLNTAFGVLMALPLIYAGARLYALNVEEPNRAFKVLRPYFHLVYIAIALTLGTIGLFLIYYSDKGSVNDYVGKMFIFAGVFLAATYLLIRKWIDKCVWQLCCTDPPVQLG
jgi:hypothetical protein